MACGRRAALIGVALMVGITRQDCGWEWRWKRLLGRRGRAWQSVLRGLPKPESSPVARSSCRGRSRSSQSRVSGDSQQRECTGASEGWTRIRGLTETCDYAEFSRESIRVGWQHDPGDVCRRASTIASCALRGCAVIVEGMVNGRLSPCSDGTRFMADVLLMAFLLLTAGPVCGSPSDVDPVACCQHHGCQRSMWVPTTAGNTSRQMLHLCAGNGEPCPSSDSPEDCCQRGDIAYPVAKAQSSVSISPLAFNPLAVMPALALKFSTIDGACVHAVDTSPPLMLAFIALYNLHSAYRV
jgi:hypothetical protein